MDFRQRGGVEIIHEINSGIGSMGSPILNLKTSKVFGIHESFLERKSEGICERYGLFLYYDITKFKEQYISKNK